MAPHTEGTDRGRRARRRSGDGPGGGDPALLLVVDSGDGRRAGHIAGIVEEALPPGTSRVCVLYLHSRPASEETRARLDRDLETPVVTDELAARCRAVGEITSSLRASPGIPGPEIDVYGRVSATVSDAVVDLSERVEHGIVEVVMGGDRHRHTVRGPDAGGVVSTPDGPGRSADDAPFYPGR